MTQRPSDRRALWRVASASALGAGHVRSGLPNQDCHGHTRIGEILVIAVADGHGGRRYVRSNRGARFAVDAALAAAERYAALSPEEVRAEFPGRLLALWQEQVNADHAAQPFTEAEVSRAGVDLCEGVSLAYGSTCLVAMVRPDGILLVQIGDGDVLVRAGRRTIMPVSHDDRLIGNITTSLCSPNAVTDFRFGWVDERERPDLLLVASDGYGNSFAASDWETRVAEDFAAQIEADGWVNVTNALPRWASDSAQVGGDDVTIVVASRDVSPAAADTQLFQAATEPAHTLPAPVTKSLGPPVTASTTAAEPRATRASSRRPQRDRRRRITLVALALLCLATAGTAYAVTRSDPARTTPGATTPGVATTVSHGVTVSPTPTPSLAAPDPTSVTGNGPAPPAWQPAPAPAGTGPDAQPAPSTTNSTGPVTPSTPTTNAPIPPESAPTSEIPPVQTPSQVLEIPQEQ